MTYMARNVDTQEDDRYSRSHTGFVGSKEELEMRSEDDLYSLNDQLVQRIDWARNEAECKQLEVELCYVQRELDVRRLRAEAAADYAERMRAEALDEE